MKKPLVIVFVILGLVFLGLAVYYWVTPAGSLPHSFPGYQAGSVHKHLKHGAAALLLGLGCGVIAWFAMGKKPTSTEA
jgi:uncharacterized membrane protein YdjX (TVP38/TMEM64 family)